MRFAFILRVLPELKMKEVGCVCLLSFWITGALVGFALASERTEFIVSTREDEAVKIDFTKYIKDLKIAPKVLISQKPKHGVFPCLHQQGSIDLHEGYCDVITSYLPNPDFSGEDTFAYSYLHENMTATKEGNYFIRVIVKPKPNVVEATSDYATMTTEDDHVRVPVLENDLFKDKADVCIQKSVAAVERDSEVHFEDVAPNLGMTSMQASPPKAPDCLFDQYDPKLKLWIKGSFCLPDLGSGTAALADYDGDGLMDIYYARTDGPDELWRNMGNGTYRLATTEAGLDGTVNHRSTALAWADIDNDGDPDLFIGTMAEKRFYLYINDGMGSFTEEAVKRGVALRPVIPPYQTSTMTIAVGDYDKDGWLDFYTTEWLPHLDQSFDYENASHSNCKLLRNLGGQGKPGYFEDVTEKAGLHRTLEPTVDADRMEGGVDVRYYGVFNTGLLRDILPGPYKLSAMFTDLDNDGYLDLAVNGDFRTSAIYWNNGNGTFTDGTKSSGVGTDENGMGSTVADYDFDGLQDWFLTSIHITEEQMKPFYEVYLNGGFIFGYTGNRLYKNKGGRRFTDATDSAGVRIGQWAWGAALFDFDNDGDLDLIHTNGFNDPDNTDADFLHGTRSKLFENKFFDDNNDKVRFEEVGEARGITDRKDGRGLFVFDYEDDGDLDVFIANNADKPILYRNIGGNKNDFIRINAVEADSGRESIGARVFFYSPRLKKDILKEIRSVSAFSSYGETTAHFGLGSETAKTFTIRVHWPVTNNTRIIEKVTRRSTLTVRDIKGQRNAIEVMSSPDESVAACTRTLVKEVTRSPSHGHVTFGPKHVTYYPNTGFSGEDSFDYSIGNGVSLSIARVKVKVSKPEKASDSSNSDKNPSDKYASIDGVGNNIHNPNWGKPMMPLLRLAAPAYADGYDEPAGQNRPSPRETSNALFDQRIDVWSKEGLNDFHMNFGQLVAHDTDFATPYANFMAEENFGIAIPKGDPWFDPHASGNEIMRFRRSARLQTTGKMHGVPREQVNKITAFLDLSVVYGSQRDRTLVLREMKNGKMLHQRDSQIIPPNTKQVPNLNLLHGPRDKMLVSGDNRVNVQPGLIALHSVFSREHNLICDELLQRPGNEGMDDETLFQHARALTRAKWQKIVWDEYLPTVIGIREYSRLGSYQGYNASIEFGIFNEFSTAAFRFGHSQIGNTMLRLDGKWEMSKFGHLSLRDAYFNPGRVVQEGGIEPLIRGMLKQLAQNVDTKFTDSVRNFLFGTNTKGLDLAAIGIQRGRDHGLSDYNTVREAIRLPKRVSFDQITSDKDLQKKFEVYKSADDIDLWVGGLAEDHVEGGCVGETFARIIAEQFRILRDGDRFWYENPDTMLYNVRDRPNLPTKGWTMNDVLYRTTGIKWKDSTFHVKSGVNMDARQ